MSDLLGVATICLTALTQASLQLSFGALILLYNASLGRHKKKRTRYLTRSYVLGVASISFLVLSSFAFLISIFTGNGLPLPVLFVVAGVLIASSLVMQFLYFRKGKNTELWLPRNISRYIARRAKKSDDAIETFSLGMLSSLVEFPLSIALYLIAANAITRMSAGMQLVGLLVYTLLACSPLLYLKLKIRSGKNALEMQAWRRKNKSFLKTIACGNFLTLAFFLIGFWIIQ